MTADGLPPLRDVINTFGLSAQKRLGQNFLLDLNLTGRIARASGPLENHTVIEVGPGPGGLTRALLLERAAKVIAIERDARCIAALQEISDRYPGRLTIIEGDATKINMAGLAEGPTKVVANLPYNVATVLLIEWIKSSPWPPWFETLTLMFQKEVAERIVAAPGSKAYGRLGILAQWRMQASKLFDVDRRAFTPPPKVTSSIVHLTPRETVSPECSIGSLERVTAAAFGQRRKMLRSSLKSLSADVDNLIARSGLEPTSRAEQVDISGFCRLAQILDHSDDH